MIVFLKAALVNKSQAFLFDAPVHVGGHVRRDGTYVAPHTRVQKVAAKEPTKQQLALFREEHAPAPAPAKQTKLDQFVARQGGLAALSAKLHALTAEQRATVIQKMADLVPGKTTADIEATLPAPTDVPQKDLFGQADPSRAADDARIDRRPERLQERRQDASAHQHEGEREQAAQSVATAPWGVPAGITKGARRAINTRVAALVADGGVDLDLMRQYSGNGGCGDSLNEFYTDPDVARAQWAVIQRLGVEHGTALEPSCATGVYLHTAPSGFKVTGVEMDPISSACAVALHGERHEVVPSTSMERFARSDGGRQFSAVVGNPPYGPRGSLAKDDKPELKTAESYFIDTALDKCEPGGIVSLVVPASVLNNKNGRAFRQRMLCKAEFLGAQRMPNTAFEASHTDVTADVIWLRKRGDDVAGALGALNRKQLQAVGVWDPEFLAGTYFEGRGKDNVLGQVGTAMRAYGEVYTVNGTMHGVPDAIRNFEPHPVGATPTVQDVASSLGDDEAAVKKAMGAAMIRPYADGKAGDTKVVDGVQYVLQGRPLRWHRVDEVLSHGAVVDGKPLAAQIEAALRGEPVDHTALTAAVQAYVALHGIPAKSQQLVAAADHDRVLHRLIGAVDHDGRLSDVVTGRQAQVVVGSLDTAAATLAAEREDGTFTAADLAERSGKSRDEVEDALIASSAYAYAGQGRWTTMDQYLTGELWPKLDAARSPAPEPGLAAKLAMQAGRLEETIGPKSLDDVEIMLNSAFIPTRILQAWMDARVAAMREKDPTSKYYRDLPEAHVSFEGGIYTVSGGEWGLADTLKKYLNRTGIRKDDMPAVDRLNDEFRAWLLTSNYRDEIEELYNRKFRGFVEPTWSEAPIEIPGLAADKLKPYHYSSLRWALARGKGIIADDVGLGKTVRGLMLARLAKMYGKAKKPTFVVPKSVLANWAAEVNNWFPGSRVLIIGETYSTDKAGNLKSRPDTEAERNRKYHDLTQNDYDFVFISQPSFNELDVDPITKGQYLGEDFWVQRGDKLGNAGDKQVRKVREAYEQAVANREFEKRTDAIYFNDLGIDMLIVDEAHAYKNLYAARARFGESPKFLGGQGQSNRAFDMSFKAKWLREQNGGNGIYSLTATPTKNSPLEVYSMLSYIAPEAFERIGIRNSEEFLDRYCVFKNENVLGTNGEIDEALVTVGFKNLDELREIMARYIMRRKASDVGLALPESKQEMHLVDMTREQSAVYGELRAQLAEAGTKDDTGDAHIFSIMSKMAKAAMDLELLDPEKHRGAASPKYDAAAKEIVAGAKDGGQVVFCESVDSHEKIAQALVAAGMPRSRIAILNATTASSSAARQNISDKFNDGRIDVVIGNKVMEEGVNLQKRTTDIHHLDTPWDPATLQQRNGRGVRQGNVNSAVRLHTYLARGSFDGYRYQSMRAKRDWSESLWSGGDRIDNLAREGVFSREDMMIMMSADPEAERAKLAADKEAAMQRLTAQRTTEAAGEFVRFQSLKRSLRGLKNKDSAAARRLQAQIERARTGLAGNKYFRAKEVLDSNDEVLINPSTGEIVQRDHGLEVDEPDGTASRWVVTGVDPVKQTVSMRRYADTTGHGGVVVPAEKLATGCRPFTLDKAAEAAEVRAVMEERAQKDLNSLTSFEQVQKMPSTVLEANHDLIQRQMKEGAKAYKFHFPYGDVHMVNRATGEIERFESYEHTKKHDTHDYLLPTDANREKAIQAWIEARREAKVGQTIVQRARGKRARYGDGEWYAKRDYPGTNFNNRHVNPHQHLLENWAGSKTSGLGRTSPYVKEAAQRLYAEQMGRIQSAPTLQEAVEHALPLAKVSGGGERASGEGEMRAALTSEVMQALVQRMEALGSDQSRLTSGKHASYVLANVERMPAFVVLAGMARAAGDPGMAAKLLTPDRIRAVPKDLAPRLYDTLAEWAKSTYSHPAERADMWRAALVAAEHAGSADTTPASYGYSYDPERGKTIRQRIEGHVKQAEEQAAIQRAKETEAA